MHQKIEQLIDECRKVSQQHCLDEPFDMPSVIWHETQGQIQAYQKVLALVDEELRLRKQKQEIWRDFRHHCPRCNCPLIIYSETPSGKITQVKEWKLTK